MPKYRVRIPNPHKGFHPLSQSQYYLKMDPVEGLIAEVHTFGTHAGSDAQFTFKDKQAATKAAQQFYGKEYRKGPQTLEEVPATN